MTLKQFEKQQYLNIETFRKNGQGVKTPVWFVQDGETLLVWTEAGSGKAKRIRSDGTVRVAPSTGSGEPVGEWLPARAQSDESPEALQHLEKLMKKKYGIMFNIFGFLGRLRGGSKSTAIKIQV
jgi:PPOX class probable F420-dependent enzyme